MSNLNPFVPKGSLLEQQSQSRSRLKLAVFCVVAVGTLGLVAMLIQGCKRDAGTDANPLPDMVTNTPPPMDTNNINPPLPPLDTNTPPPMASNSVPAPLPLPAPVPPTADVPPPATGGTEYVVVSGDTLGKIAKKNHVTLKDLEAANPGVDSKHLKIKQKLVIPAGGSVAPATSAASTDATATVETGSATTYTVKSGDNLHKLAVKFGVSQKAIQSANHLTTTSIKVGQKLKIPAKTHKAVKAVEPTVPPVTPDVAPTTPPPVSTAPPLSAPPTLAPVSTPAPTAQPTH